jgi:hypothetical protein
MIAEEAAKRKIYLVGLLTIKKGDLFPERPYYLFEEGHPPEHPLLSNDGKLFFTPAAKSGKFYLYSPDGKHWLVCNAGSVHSAAISLTGDYLGLCFGDSIVVIRISDGTDYRAIFLRHSDYVRRSER